jgi:hypothetical protein
MIHFYKPNQWNSGCCCSFSYNTSDKSFYVQLLKQLSWDSENSKGKFDTKTRSACKFTPTEIGSFIDCIESGRELVESFLVFTRPQRKTPLFLLSLK